MWLLARLKKTVSTFYRNHRHLSAVVLCGGRSVGSPFSVAKVMERYEHACMPVCCSRAALLLRLLLARTADLTPAQLTSTLLADPGGCARSRSTTGTRCPCCEKTWRLSPATRS